MKLTISLVETKKAPKLINKKYAKGQMEENGNTKTWNRGKLFGLFIAKRSHCGEYYYLKPCAKNFRFL